MSGAVLTSKWLEGTNITQVLELIITNNDPNNYLTLADTLTVNVSSSSLDTVVPGTLTRLAPSERAVVQIGVKNKAGVTPGTTCGGTVVATYGTKYGPAKTATQNFQGNCGIGDYVATASSLAFHWNPDWYNEVKFGIFVHWGVYSAPAYGDRQPREDYAEW